MIKSGSSVMLTKEEFENLSKKWKPILSATFEVANVLNKAILFTNDKEGMEAWDQLSPTFSQIHDNAVEATIKII